jgi:hypothetical protein
MKLLLLLLVIVVLYFLLKLLFWRVWCMLEKIFNVVEYNFMNEDNKQNWLFLIYWLLEFFVISCTILLIVIHSVRSWLK